MIISLPKDLIEITRARRKDSKKFFRFSSSMNRMIVPQEVRNSFPDCGLDLFISPKEKTLYIAFVPKEKAQFQVNGRNGYVGCKKVFEWAANAETPIFDNYEYSNYQIDKKNNIVKLELKRK